MIPGRKRILRYLPDHSLAGRGQRGSASRFRRIRVHGGPIILTGLLFLPVPARAQSTLSLPEATRLATARSPSVDTGTLLAFAWHESRFRPWAIHDNVTTRSHFPTSHAEAVGLASALLGQGHGLDLGLMQVNSANLARVGLTVATAFDAGESMRAGGLILTEAYRRCLRWDAAPGNIARQTALRCAASVYNTGREQAGILNGYQAGVWRAAAQIVPAIQLGGVGAVPPPPQSPSPVPAPSRETAAPTPRRPPTNLEDALHATPPVQDTGDGLSDALHHIRREDTP